MSNNNVPPFLELSRDTLQAFDTSGLDLENVLAVWTGLTKCSEFIKNGKRLENISWRIVNRNLVIKENKHVVEEPQLSSSVGKTRNKLNDGDLFSLLSIVSEQNVDPLRPQLAKRKSSNKNLTKRGKNNSSESLLVNRPSMFRKSSSSKSLKKMNQKRKSNVDLSSIPHDTDIFEQPNPRYAFGIYDPSTSPKDTVQAALLTRSDTSTSVIRGFVPDDPSTKQQSPPRKSPPSPRVQREKKSVEKASEKASPSLFGNYQQQLTPEEDIQNSSRTTSSLFNHERVKSPLSHESTTEVLSGRETMSLFGSQQPQKSSLFDNNNNSRSSLFDNKKQSQRTYQNSDSSGSSGQLARFQPKKRSTVLNSLGMTSLSKPHDQKKDKKMFFIESSPSPTEPKLFDANIHHDTHKPPADPHHHRHTTQKQKSQVMASQGEKQSLFEGKAPREIMFSSDDSLSDESDWSSVSEDPQSEDDEDLHEEWNRTVFKRADSAPQKPQIKRSLLSGLFLNDMQPEDSHISSPQPQMFKVAVSTRTQSRTATPAHSKPSSTGSHELSTSALSTVMVRHASKPSTDGTTLELMTSEPHTSISMTHVTASGELNEPRITSDFKAALDQQVQPSSSFSSLAKSALNLTNYFSSQRKNSFSSIASDRTRVRLKHESNAPPTASTLLPTALSTHMFLPNAHQRAKSRLAAVVESEGSEEPSRKNSESGQNPILVEKDLSGKDITHERTLHSEESQAVKPIKSPTISIPLVSQTNDDPHNFNISRKLSPKTTRKQMLATELSDSLRKSILWDRQYAYPGESQKKYVYDGNLKETQDENDPKWDADKPKVLKKEVEGGDDWDKESFYTRGW
jgi:hypothetical protein